MVSANFRTGWISVAVGAVTGLVLGLWSFDGPVAVPPWLGEYEDVSRRLARLGHIAFFGLGILNLLLSWSLPRLLPQRGLRLSASRAMIFGNVCLPIGLFAAALYHPLKYALPVPALAVAAALALAAYGAWSMPTEEP
jgi:amino acid transporter